MAGFVLVVKVGFKNTPHVNCFENVETKLLPVSSSRSFLKRLGYYMDVFKFKFVICKTACIFHHLHGHQALEQLSLLSHPASRYENEGRGRRTVKAQHLWYQILESQTETGTPYMLYKDSCNRKSNQKNLGTIKCSNLCTEIVEYTSPEEVRATHFIKFLWESIVFYPYFVETNIHIPLWILTEHDRNQLRIVGKQASGLARWGPDLAQFVGCGVPLFQSLGKRF